MSVGVDPVYRDVNVVRTIAEGRGDLEEWEPSDVTHNPVSGHILVTDWGGDCIMVFSDNPPYTYITRYGRHGEDEGEYVSPRGITCDSEGRVIVADYDSNRLQALSSTGQYLGQVTEGLDFPEWVCVDGEDNVYVADNDEICAINPQGDPLPTISRKGQGEFTISGEHLYEMGHINNPRHIHIHSLTDRSEVKSVPLPQQITNHMCTFITACRDGRLLITAQGDSDGSDYYYSYMYILDGAGRNLTPRPYRCEGRVRNTTLLYDNTLVVVDKEYTLLVPHGYYRLVLVTLPGLYPPLQPAHPVRVTSVESLCLYKIRSIVRRPHDVHKLPEWVPPGLISKLLELYPE